MAAKLFNKGNLWLVFDLFHLRQKWTACTKRLFMSCSLHSH